PVIARGHGHVHGAVAAANWGEAQAAGVHVNDGAREARVGDHQVGAAAEEQHGLAGLIGGPHRVGQLRLGHRGYECLRRAAKAKGRVAGEEGWPVVLLDGLAHGSRTVARARVSTFAPSAFATMSTVTLLSSSLSSTLPLNSMVAPPVFP